MDFDESAGSLLTLRFEAAVADAARLHNRQIRKGTGVPYVSHLLGVASLALEHGADEDEAIGALLHDAAEDQGGVETLDDIRRRYGKRVAEIVSGCSDTFEDPKPPWKARKEAYIAKLPAAGPAVLLVSACDKLHNARSILADYRRVGAAIFERFAGRQSGTLWYYRTLVGTYEGRVPPALYDELNRVVTELESQVAADSLP